MGGQSFFIPPGTQGGQAAPDPTLASQDTGLPQELASTLQRNQQQQQTPPQPQQPDAVSAGLDQAAQHYSQQLQQNQQPVASGGPIRQLLQNFVGSMGNHMMAEAGLPTALQKQQQAIQGLAGVAAAKAHLATIQSLQAQSAPVPLIGIDDKPVTGPDGSVITLPANHAATIYAARAAGQYKQVIQGMKGDTAETVAGTSAQAKVDVANIQQGGIGVPLSQTTAALAGIPEKAGQLLGKGGWAVVNSALRSRGFHVQDMGTSGSDAGMWVVDNAGTKVHQISPTSLMQARGQSFAQARAENTPFETVEPGTNIPTTISNAQALRTGAPKISLQAQTKLGGQYSLYNDAYGILDKIDTLADRVNLDDPTVRARVTAGYAALKDPASKGLSGEILSNFLARQPISDQLQPDERELILNMAQGKAAATGLRSILGQAGSNEMQQRLDAGLFPGGQAVGSKQSVKQQTAATRALLGRVSIGLPQAGLNAPNQPGNLANRSGSQPLTADEARGYLLKAGGDKAKARQLATSDGRKF